MQDEMPKIIVFLCLFSLEMEPQLSIQRKLDKIKDIIGHDILTCAIFPPQNQLYVF